MLLRQIKGEGNFWVSCEIFYKWSIVLSCVNVLKTDDETARRKKTDEQSPDDAKDEDPPKLVPVGQEKDGASFIAAADDEVRT